MLTKANMYAAIRNWVLNPSKGTIRIHLSHTDADGYCCQLVTKFMNYAFVNFDRPRYFSGIERKYKGERRVFYGNINPGDVGKQQTAIGDIIRSFTENSCYYAHGTDVLSFLVTDVGGFNPKEVFDPLIKNGHRIQYLVVDHHQDPDKLGNSEQAYKLDIYEQNVSLHSYWFDFQDFAACQHMAAAFYNTEDLEAVKKFFAHKFSHMVIDGQTFGERWLLVENRLRKLSCLCESVGLADTGNFGLWHISDYEKVDKVAAMRMLWGYYASVGESGGNLYLDDHHRALIGDDLCNTHLQNIFDLITRDEHSRIIEEYKTFEYELKSRPADIGSLIDQNVVDEFITDVFKDYKVCMCYLRTSTGGRKYPNFSMLAKEYLSLNKHIDIILGWDSTDSSYSLRSYKSDVNVADIARKFGGGGHPRAAGFKHKTEANSR